MKQEQKKKVSKSELDHIDFREGMKLIDDEINSLYNDIHELIKQYAIKHTIPKCVRGRNLHPDHTSFIVLNALSRYQMEFVEDLRQGMSSPKFIGDQEKKE